MQNDAHVRIWASKLLGFIIDILIGRGRGGAAKTNRKTRKLSEIFQNKRSNRKLKGMHYRMETVYGPE